jgi:alpha-glucosidase
MKKIALLISVLLVAAGLPAKEYQLKSPDRAIVVTVNSGEQVSYSVERAGIRLLDPSHISLMLLDGTRFGGNDRFRVSRRSVDQKIPARNFKRSSVRDHFNELTLSTDNYDIVFRAYDDGVAYRFVDRGKNGEFAVAYEQAEFAFAYDSFAYVPYVARDYATMESQFFNSFENTYAHHLISKWEKGRLAFLPLVVEGANDIKLCITEADLWDYPGMYLSNQDGSHSLRGVFASCPDRVEQGGHNMLQGLVRSRRNFLARVPAGHAFPWRVIAIAAEDRQLAESDLTWRLARPAAAGDWSWVKPGKVAWDWWNDWNLYGVDFEAGVNTDTYKYYIDFASEHGIEYVILDEGWAVNKQADLMQVIPEIDLPMLCRYAEQKHVGLILWAGYWAFNRDMEGVCKHYSDMGIKGWKIDFMDRDDQEMVRFYEKAASTAAKYHMLVDFHGAYKPTGLQRTWPNVLNFEGIHGLEQMKWSGPEVDQVTYDVTVPFARLVAGPADYTQGAMRNATRGNYHPVNTEPMSQGTRCHQLAEYIVFDAPLTMLCDSPTNYRREEECTRFIASVPTVWDETIALAGKMAEYVAIARRSGSTWYVGVLGNWDERDLEIDLGRLGVGAKQGEAFVDGINAHRAARDYRHGKVSVNGTWKVHLAPGGGAVLVL